MNDAITWSDDKGKERACRAVAAALLKVEPIVRTHGSNTYLNVAPGNVSVRDSFDRRDYNDFRPGEAGSTKPKDTIAACMRVYASNGIARNVIDLMGDFASQGIDIVHPNERIEKFYKEWFRKVGGVERSERFLNMLYRCGTVIVKRQTAKLKPSEEERLRQSKASPDMELAAPIKLLRREIPWKYSFLNPLSVEVLAEPLAPFVGQDAFQYAVRVPDAVAKVVKNPRSAAEKVVVGNLPEDIRRIIQSGQHLIPLDKDKLSVHSYKRDDWQAWATPMMAPMLNDFNMLEKMKLADLAALDGAISCIRVWKLGSLEAKIMPSEVTIMRLAEMLNNNVGGGVMDLIWGPDIELMETSSDVHQFLGETKYAPVLNALFQGFGVPPTLTGNANPGGFTNNYISMKTLTERLEYGRAILRTFWEEEIRLVQKAMEFRFPAEIVFDQLLTDEAAEKKLLIDLLDRDLISDESVLEYFNLNSDIEKIRVRREYRRRRQRNSGSPPKVGPYHAEFANEMEKIFAQSGAYTPAQFGIELEEAEKGQKSPLEVTAKLTPKPVAAPAPGGGPPGKKPAGRKGVPGEGRPLGQKDSEKRKQKVVKPRTKASAAFVANMAWAEEAQGRIAAVMGPRYMRAIGKSTLRELTSAEANDFEAFKFGVLCQLPFGGEFTEAQLDEIVATPLAVPGEMKQLLRATVTKYVEASGREPSTSTLRRFQASVYAMFRGNYEAESGPADDGVSQVSRTGEEPDGDS